MKSAYVNQAKVYGGIAALGFLCNVLSQVGLTGLSGILAYQGIISIGAIFSITNLTGNIFNGVGNLPNYLSYIKSTEPIFNKFNLFIKKNYDNQAELKGTSESPFLEMKNIEFSYPNATKKLLIIFLINSNAIRNIYLMGLAVVEKVQSSSCLLDFTPPIR